MPHGPRTYTESGMTEEPARKKPGDPIDAPAEPVEAPDADADDEAEPAKKPAPKPHKGR